MLGVGGLLVAAVLSVGMESVSDEVTLGSTHQPGTNLRSGFFSNFLTASLMLSDRWLLDVTYTLSKTEQSTFTHVIGAGASFAATDSVVILASAQVSPDTITLLPLCIPTLGGPLCATMSERMGSVGGNVLAAWDSGVSRNVEVGVDGSYSPTYYWLKYRLEDGRFRGLKASFGIQQHRLGVGSTLHLFRVVDVDLRASYSIFLGADDEALQRGLSQSTGGLPIAPRLADATLSVTAFFLDRRLSAKAGVLVGRYADPCLGSTGQLTVRVTGRPGPVRVWGSVTVQSDWPPLGNAQAARCAERLGGALQATVGGYASLGAEYLF